MMRMLRPFRHAERCEALCFHGTGVRVSGKTLRFAQDDEVGVQGGGGEIRHG